MSLRILYIGHRNSIGKMSSDSLTQSNPVNTGKTVGAGGAAVAVHANSISDTLAGQINEKGLLGGAVVFTRPDVGNDVLGGAPDGVTVLPAQGGWRPLGLAINDAVGNPFENTPGVASGRAPYTSGLGTYAVDIYETKNLVTAAAISYAPGDLLYASVNGLLTNRSADSLEASFGLTPTVVGVVKQAPVPGSVSEMVLDQRI